jgi:hypothetical protein
MLGTFGFGGNCSPCNTDTYADIDWTKDKKVLTFNIVSTNINFVALEAKSIDFNIATNDIKFDINKSKDIMFDIDTKDIRFTVSQLSCG